VKLPIRVALVGLGKIAHDQHLPNIAKSAEFELVAAAAPEGTAAGVPNFRNIESMLASGIGMDAVVLCQPPQFRFHAAALALRAGKHVLLEKPPGATTLEVDQLEILAKECGTTLYTAWHSRLAPGVAPARAWLAQRRILGVRIEWLEDVQRWHPGQTWIWEAGGFGVFDPGINALSILTHLMPDALRLMDGTLEVPRGGCAPIRAQLHLRSVSEVSVHAVFDWRHTGPEIWSLHFDTDLGELHLSRGGAALQVGDQSVAIGASSEYEKIYRRFAMLARARACEVDTAPLRLVGDAFMRCQIREVVQVQPVNKSERNLAAR
jgi:D-galactose 1-dehydrogenase